VAKYVPYKGNRSLKVKPVHLQEARDYLVRKWGAVISEGEEADDLIGIASSFGSPDTTVVCTIDKDMLQLPCWHFNFVRGTWVRVSVDEGNKFFYTQILTGDAADNIKGIYRVGPIKAGKILRGLTTEGEMYEACVQAYATSDEALKVNPDCWIEYGKARVLENARLLWLRRYVGQMWEPPE
jgi:5'-3' exonuclease